MKLNRVEEAIETIRDGGIVVVVDDKDREHEGDLIAAAELATGETINFMVTHGRGLVCIPLVKSIIETVGLEPMTRSNGDPMGTAFTVSVDHADTTTGISAYERALTCTRLAAADAAPGEFTSPGHLFPLVAAEGGVLRRGGHTEAAVDLSLAAGLRGAAVICEILKDDGTMARTDDLLEFAQKHKLPIITIEQLIRYRREKESSLKRDSVVTLPTAYGEFTLHTYIDTPTGEHHLALVKGDISREEVPLVRLHSECLTGDVFHSHRCDCGDQLDTAMKMIAEEGQGVVVYLRQEGRGIGLVNKMRAYALQEKGFDTVEANEHLGFAPDERSYRIGAEILQNLGISSVRLLTNNPDKVSGLETHGVEVSRRLPLVTGLHSTSRKYMEVKSRKMGHLYHVKESLLEATS